MCHIAMHMDQDLQQFQTPGQYIQFLLEEKGWSQKVLAVVLQVDEAIVNKIISGKKTWMLKWRSPYRILFLFRPMYF